jgi:hypothetical protein
MTYFKLIILIIFLIFKNISFAQCNYSKKEVDKFTGVTKIETTEEVLHRDFTSAMSFTFCKYDSLYFIRVGINLSDKIYSILKGDKLMIICNESTIALESLVSEVIQGFSHVNYLITKEQINILNKHNISDIRIYLRDSYVEKTISSKRAEKIKQLSNCINY